MPIRLPIRRRATLLPILLLAALWPRLSYGVESTVSDPRADELARRVVRSLEAEPLLEGAPIKIWALDGTVYLNGRVGSSFARDRAEAAAARVPGVSNVVNQLIYPVARQAEEDLEIARAIEERIRANPLLDSSAINVWVSAGIATLEGTVDSPVEQKLAADAAIRGGARGAVNHLKIRKRGTSNEAEKY